MTHPLPEPDLAALREEIRRAGGATRVVRWGCWLRGGAGSERGTAAGGGTGVSGLARQSCLGVVPARNRGRGLTSRLVALTPALVASCAPHRPPAAPFPQRGRPPGAGTGVALKLL